MATRLVRRIAEPTTVHGQNGSGNEQQTIARIEAGLVRSFESNVGIDIEKRIG
jgi:ABC-type transport system involved in cytochrome c biogenesis ATPase subunit